MRAPQPFACLEHALICPRLLPPGHTSSFECEPFRQPQTSPAHSPSLSIVLRVRSPAPGCRPALLRGVRGQLRLQRAERAGPRLQRRRVRPRVRRRGSAAGAPAEPGDPAGRRPGVLPGGPAVPSAAGGRGPPRLAIHNGRRGGAGKGPSSCPVSRFCKEILIGIG